MKPSVLSLSSVSSPSSLAPLLGPVSQETVCPFPRMTLRSVRAAYFGPSPLETDYWATSVVSPSPWGFRLVSRK